MEKGQPTPKSTNTRNERRKKRKDKNKTETYNRNIKTNKKDKHLPFYYSYCLFVCRLFTSLLNFIWLRMFQNAVDCMKETESRPIYMYMNGKNDLKDYRTLNIHLCMHKSKFGARTKRIKLHIPFDRHKWHSQERRTYQKKKKQMMMLK